MYDLFRFCDLNNFELSLVIRLYIVASLPLLLALYCIVKNRVSRSTSLILLSSFLIVALGWEIWLTYGIHGGLPVDERRTLALSCAIPIHLNWILNSLADVMIIWVGLFLVKACYKNKTSAFMKWKWGAFFILFAWFIAQNIYVEAFFYHLQLGSNGDLSWAPLQPLGSWYNPILFRIGESPITFQSQSSWVLMTPIVYWLSIYFERKRKFSN